MSKNILIVARWPLGGIRTYMRYMFRYFPKNYNLTILAASTQENEALARDVTEYGAHLIITKQASFSGFVKEIFFELKNKHSDIILSQGFISAVAVFLANLPFKIPHILTIHGIVEPRYLTGHLVPIKRFFLKWILSRITVHYGVSKDILSHLYEQFPSLKECGSRSIVIPNGIEMSEFNAPQNMPNDLRNHLNLSNSTFLFGFFGRFMQQKGFDLLIEAVNILIHQEGIRPFAVLAVGSGDYIRELQQKISKLGVAQCFKFIPFQHQVHQLYPQVDAIVMPSRWEASGLLAMEALCMGTPLIASDCMGLRETVFETPAMIFPSEDVGALVNIMRECMVNNKADEFKRFIPSAKKRYDVSNSSQLLVKLIESIT